MLALAWVSFTLRSGVAVVFTYYGVAKIFAPKGSFELVTSRYRLLPSRFVRPVAFSLPWVETILGMLLLLDVAPVVTGLGLLLLLLSFQVAVGSALARGIEMSCGCRGQDKINKSELRLALLRNFVIMAALLAFEMPQLVHLNPLVSLLPLEIVLFSLAFLAATLSAPESRVTAIIRRRSAILASNPIGTSRRKLLIKASAVAMGFFGWKFFDQSNIALARVPAPCDCSCLGGVYEAADCLTYCPPGCGCPCSAPLWAIYYEECCNYAGRQCDISLALIGYYPCC